MPCGIQQLKSKTAGKVRFRIALYDLNEIEVVVARFDRRKTANCVRPNRLRVIVASRRFWLFA